MKIHEDNVGWFFIGLFQCVQYAFFLV